MITLSQDEIDIMGRPNFSCAGIAKILIAAGIYADLAKKAEYEQAVYIHWALSLKDQYAENWRIEGGKILDDCIKKLDNEEETTA